MSVDGSGFLYPFLDEREDDAGTLLADLASSARAKASESAALREATAVECADVLAAAAADIAERFRRGGRLYTFGNGGSATDAATLADLFARPPHGRPLPARSLAADQATLTALGNDIGFEVVFSRQLIAHARDGDIAVALSTSGGSADLLTALTEARKRGLLTIGLAGYDGGRFASGGAVDHCLVVRSQSVHRIQESQAWLGYRLWSDVQGRLSTRHAISTEGAR